MSDDFDFDGTRSQPRGNTMQLWDMLSILVLIITVCLAGYFVWIFLNPQSSFNFFPPGGAGRMLKFGLLRADTEPRGSCVAIAADRGAVSRPVRPRGGRGRPAALRCLPPRRRRPGCPACGRRRSGSGRVLVALLTRIRQLAEAPERARQAHALEDRLVLLAGVGLPVW